MIYSVKELLKQRILLLDGAMGTMIQSHNLTEADFRGNLFTRHAKPLKGNNDILSLTRPDIIQGIHEAYFEAGADIVETNTFCATAIAQADYDMQDQVYEMNKRSAEIAAEAAQKYTALQSEKPRFVAGSIGPTNRTASMSPDVNDPAFRAVTFDQLVEVYTTQVRGLLQGGVDLLLVETVFDTLNAKAALFAIEEAFSLVEKRVPVMVSGTITDASGRTLSGQTPEAFLISLQHAELLSIGFNCALGAQQLRPHIKVLADQAPFFVSVHPNAGLPNAFGEYEQSPEQMAAQIEAFLKMGLVNIIGGCCGTTPDHIAALNSLAAKYQPRTVVENQSLSLNIF